MLNKTFTKVLILVLLIAINLSAQQTEAITLHTETGDIEGVLTIPEEMDAIPLVVLIAGSGPTDRDGNNPVMKNYAYKMMADSLMEHGVACLRYDKRGIGESQQAMKKESAIRFEHYVEDASNWVALMREDDRFDQIYIVGHSEGSLIGMLAAQKSKLYGYISIAGVGRPANEILEEQLSKQAPLLLDEAIIIMDSLVQGKTMKNKNPMLESLFRESVQPYLISWFRYDPAREIAKLKVPVLIVQGGRDIQVGIKDAELLANASGTDPVIIDEMSHILKNAPEDYFSNLQTYYDSALPVSGKLVHSLIGFIKGN